MKRRKLWALLLATVMMLGLTACGGSSDDTSSTDTSTEDVAEESEETTEAADSETHENVVIEAHIVQTDWSDAWDVMEERFEEQYSWIDVQAVGIGESNDDFITARSAAGDLPDIIQLDYKDIYLNLADDGKIADASQYAAADNIPQSYKDAFMYNGELLGLTQGSAFSAMYYNMDILEQAGWTEVPTNWTELIQCCKDIQEKTGVAPLTVAGSKTTTMWMIFELILANECGEELGQGTYEEEFQNGTFDFTKYPDLVSKLDEIAPYFLEGSATMTEDDVTAAMTDGLAAMCVAGNWTAGTILPGIEECTGDASKAMASLPPFNDEGKDVWISVSPETAFAVTVDETRSADEQEAVDIFFEWVFQPENFMLIQNARGTVPVLSTLTEEQIVLPDQISAILEDMNAAPFVKMGFNLWTVEFKDAACTALQDCIAGNGTAQAAVDTMWSVEQESYFNK